jgi:hypothetical protein
VSDAGEFIDAGLQRESLWYNADESSGIARYGASVGAVRGTVRDALRRYRDLDHDAVTALASELWSVPVVERRLAAIVLLQTHVRSLIGTDLTRIEGFVRDARLEELFAPLVADVLVPLLDGLDPVARSRAEVALTRWAAEPNDWLQRAAMLVNPR